ncbi:MAG TPA: TonB-dependent receptor [Paucimonas sp.]|nr:TonB-dependent receptor [Paucimonas sp.]
MLVLATLFLPPLHAQPARDGDFLELLTQENQVFSASRYVQTMAETPANVTVLTRGDLKRFGYRNIGEALAALPGVYDAASQWPALGVRGFAVPGDFGSRILTLVNGMPIYEATYGSFFIEQLDMESIDRIEFVKGPGSALYGSGAVLAVVNLITRSGHDAASKSIAAEVASHRGIKLYGSWGQGGAGGADTFLSASVGSDRGRDLYLREMDAPGFDPVRLRGMSIDNDRSDTLRLFGRAAYGNTWLQGLYITADKRDPLASYGTVLNGRLHLKEMLGAVEAGVSGELAGGALGTARAYYFGVAEEGDYPYTFSGARVPPVDYINVSDLASRQYGIELRYDRFLSNGHHLLAGGEAKRVESHQQVGDQPGPARSGVVSVDSRPRYSQWALFIQDEIRFGRDTLFLGARYDAYRGFSEGVRSRLSPRIVYLRNISENTTGKLIYGEAYRAPTVYESLYQDGVPAAETLWANPKLRPELARTFEALFEHRPRPGVQMRLSMFRMRLADSPAQIVTPEFAGTPCALGPEGCIQYRNSGVSQSVIGFEADLRMKQSDHGSLYASLSCQRSRQEGQELASSPRHQIKFGASRVLPWAGMDAAFEAHYIGRARGRFEGGGRTADAPSYLLVNAALNAGQLTGGWRASLRINNLLDRKIYTIASRELQPLERVPGEERRFSLQLQHDF